MPAHITLLHPFYAPDDTSEQVLGDLRSACSEIEPTLLSLGRFQRFPGGVLWLAPEPADPLVRIIERLAVRYPDFPRYEGAFAEIVPHATVAESRDPALLDRIVAAVEPALPVSVHTVDAWLMHRRPDGWAVRARLPFKMANSS
jgi:2'-5' RNA ligase